MIGSWWFLRPMCVLVCLGLLVISRVSPSNVLAHDGPHDDSSPSAKVLHAVEDDLLKGREASALRRLDAYDREYGGRPGHEDENTAAAVLRFQVLESMLRKSISGGLPSPDALRLLGHLTAHHLRLDGLLENRRLGDVAEGREYRALQGIARRQEFWFRVAAASRSAREYAAAMAALDSARALFIEHRVQLEKPIRHTTLGADQSKVQTEAVWKVLRLQSPEQLRREMVSTATMWHERTGEQAARDALGQQLKSYLDEFPRSAYAGVYTDVSMKLAEEFDLDRLVAAYAACEDKTHPQYVYSSLGLANLLLRADRASEALPYLESVKERGIEASRMPELYYQLGTAHLKLGNKDEALGYFLAVRKMSDKFEVGPFLELLDPGRADLQAEAADSSAARQPRRALASAGWERTWVIVLNIAIVAGLLGLYTRRRVFRSRASRG